MANAKAQALSSHAFDACGGGGAAPTGSALKAMASFDDEDWAALDMDARIAMEESSVEEALCLENPGVRFADIEAASAASRAMGSEPLSADEAARMEELAHPPNHIIYFLDQGSSPKDAPKDPPPRILPQVSSPVQTNALSIPPSKITHSTNF